MSYSVKVNVCKCNWCQVWIYCFACFLSLLFMFCTRGQVTDTSLIALLCVIYIIKGVMFVCLFVCLYLCSVWPAKCLGRSRPNLTHALMSTQGVFLSRSMSRSFMYACGSDRITKHPERCAKATPGERCSNYIRRRGRRHLANAYETSSGWRVVTAQVTRRGAAASTRYMYSDMYIRCHMHHIS